MRRSVMMVLALAGAAVPALAQPVAESGPVTVRAGDEEEGVQDAASVVVVNDLRQQGDLGGKLFGTAGGDPAMNGLYTYLAFYLSPADGWRVFRIGDFLDYRIISETRGRLLLDVHESIMNAASGEIGSRHRRLAVSWTAGPGPTPPTTITVATAR
jgi:hypothetical protein